MKWMEGTSSAFFFVIKLEKFSGRKPDELKSNWLNWRRIRIRDFEIFFWRDEILKKENNFNNFLLSMWSIWKFADAKIDAKDRYALQLRYCIALK